ncbi:MAG: hypothetical protein NTX87_10350 [Planctomycetota bacterium]|nr:hypothetical protein [Planctomycetota bacterium]
MTEEQKQLAEKALDFLAAASRVSAQAGGDPLDQVSTAVFELGHLAPIIDEPTLAKAREDLAAGRLAPQMIVNLVPVARQIALAFGLAL